MILDKINGPDDVKKLNETELRELAEEIRSFLIEKISHTGGHPVSYTHLDVYKRQDPQCDILPG